VLHIASSKTPPHPQPAKTCLLAYTLPHTYPNHEACCGISTFLRALRRALTPASLLPFSLLSAIAVQLTAMAGEPHSLEEPGEAEVTLSFEPVDSPKPRAAPPTPEVVNPPAPTPASIPKQSDDVEYDEFGLPVKKLSAPAYDDETTDDETPPTPAAMERPKPNELSEPIKPSAPPATGSAPPPTPVALIASAVEEKKEEVVIEKKEVASADDAAASKHRRNESLMSLPEEDRVKNEVRMFSEDPKDPSMPTGAGTVSEWSHQQIVPRGGQAERVFEKKKEKEDVLEDEWQEMPAYAPYDLYDDDGRLIARAKEESEDEEDTGAAKGYTRVYDDEDADSVTSMDENTSYLFKENEDDEAARNPLSQMKATKELLTEGQRVAYVGVVRLALIEMLRDLQRLQAKGRTARRNLQQAVDGMIKWSQKIMVRLYTHMELSPPGMPRLKSQFRRCCLVIDLA
jgi:hypothetical protein